MYKVLLVIHVMVTLALIVIVLVQRSSSEGIGLSGSSSSNNFLSGRAAANFASRSTAVLAFIFIMTSLLLGVLTTQNHVANGSIADKIKATGSPLTPTSPANADPLAPTPTTSVPAAEGKTPTAPVTPEKPATPSVPRPE